MRRPTVTSQPPALSTGVPGSPVRCLHAPAPLQLITIPACPPTLVIPLHATQQCRLEHKRSPLHCEKAALLCTWSLLLLFSLIPLGLELLSSNLLQLPPSSPPRGTRAVALNRLVQQPLPRLYTCDSLDGRALATVFETLSLECQDTVHLRRTLPRRLATRPLSLIGDSNYLLPVLCPLFHPPRTYSALLSGHGHGHGLPAPRTDRGCLHLVSRQLIFPASAPRASQLAVALHFKPHCWPNERQNWHPASTLQGLKSPSFETLLDADRRIFLAGHRRSGHPDATSTSTLSPSGDP